MALKIRLRKQGRTHRPFYRLVVMDGRRKRDGEYVEKLGWYNPVEEREELHLSVNAERVQHWLDQGAVLTEKAEKLVARAAPAVIKGLTEKRLARRAKRRQKRKKAA